MEEWPAGSSPRTDPGSPRRRWKYLLLVLAGVSIAYLLYVNSFSGDRVDSGILVNETSESLRIYSLTPGAEEVLWAEIPPRSEIDSMRPCVRGLLVARTADGREVTRHGPFSECNDEDWVIRET